jgi:hypothetical protein
MSQDAAEEFAKALIEQVRDKAIHDADRMLTNKGPWRDRWRKVVATMSPEEVLHELIPDIVDCSVRKLLAAIEEGEPPLHLLYQPQGGQAVDLAIVGKGEMLGNYADEEAWIARYSHERFYPYMAEGASSEEIRIPKWG